MTTPNDAAVRAACERIIAAGDDTCYHLSPQGIKDADLVARAYLATLPAPATPESISGFDFWEGGSSGTPAPASPAAEGRP